MMDTDRDNNIGLLRLILAALVIVSHTPEMIDGDRSRELATAIWHTLSFGEIAVDGFFIVSGYLITRSYQRSKDWLTYINSRAFRIYPAFIVSFAFCIFFVAPIAGESFPDPAGNSVRLLPLQPPYAAEIFDGLAVPVLNGAMWSIAYEFRCYLLVLFLGLIGALRWRGAIASTGIACLLFTGFGLTPHWTVPGDQFGVFGYLPFDVRMTGVFLVGMSFYLYRDLIHYKRLAAGAALLLLSVMLFVPPLAELSLAVLGGYFLFWFSFKGPRQPFAKRADISYGLYLYAWPIGALLTWYFGPDASPWWIGAVTLLVAGALGAASWYCVERPALALGRGLRPQATPS